MRLGPTGYTRNPQIREVLDPCETEIATGHYHGGAIHFRGLSGEGLRQIAALLPDRMQDDACDPEAPSFREFVGLSELYQTMQFQGYRITPEREDERITITGCTLHGKEATPEVVARLRTLNPRVVRDGFLNYRFCWD